MTSEVSSSVPLPRFWRGIAGAIVATLVLELLLRFAAPLVIGHVVRPALLVNRLLGLPPASLAGTVVHLALALVVLPLGFVWIIERLVPGSLHARALVYALLLGTLIGMVLLPLAGVPDFFGSQRGGVFVYLVQILYCGLFAGLLGERQ